MRKLSVLVSLIALVLMLPACIVGTQTPPEGTTTPTSSPSAIFSPSSPIKVSLSISKLPLLNETADLTCSVMSMYDAPNSSAQIVLPQGIGLVSGDLRWQGDLQANNAISFLAKVVFKVAGHQTIEATAKHVVDTNNSWGDMDAIYLDIGSEASTFGWPVTPVQVVRVPDKWSVIKTDLQVSHAPKLNEPAKLFVTILSPIDFPGMTAEIIFYQGVELLEGAKKQPIDLKADVPVHFTAIIVFTETGFHPVTADTAELVNGVWYSSPQATLSFNIGTEQSSYQQGWPSPTQEPTEIPPPPPAIHP